MFSSVQALEVKNLQGKSLDIEVLGYNKSSGNVRMKRTSDGMVLNVQLNIFDAESQKQIIKVAPKAKADLEAKVSIGRRRKDVPGSSYMKTQTITAKVMLENNSRDIDFSKGTATLLMVGRQTKRYANDSSDYGQILAKQSFQVNLVPSQEAKYEAKPIVTKYDSDRDSSNVGGWEYYGWVLVIQDETKTIHTIETNIGNLKTDVEKNPRIGANFLKLNKGQTVEKDLRKR